MTLDAATQARLVGLFVAEAEEALRELAAGHLKLAAGPDGEALHAFGRTAHGLKGASAALGFEPLARLLHALEERALGLAAPDGAARAACHDAIGLALQRLEAGLIHMSAAGAGSFPEAAVDGAREALEAPAGAPPPAPAPAARPPAPHAADAVVESLTVPAAEVDEALRLAASLARAAAELEGSAAGPGGSRRSSPGSASSRPRWRSPGWRRRWPSWPGGSARRFRSRCTGGT